MRVGGKNPKIVWWSYEVKATFKRKEVLGARGEDVKERCMEANKEEKKKIKRCKNQSKKEINEGMV